MREQVLQNLHKHTRKPGFRFPYVFALDGLKNYEKHWSKTAAFRRRVQAVVDLPYAHKSVLKVHFFETVSSKPFLRNRPRPALRRQVVSNRFSFRKEKVSGSGNAAGLLPDCVREVRRRKAVDIHALCLPRMPADAERRKIGKYNLIYLIVYDIIHLKNKATLYFPSTNTSWNIFLKSDIIKSQKRF